MQNPIHVGIIGLGRSGWKLHAETLSTLPNFKIAAVADPESPRREEAVARFGCAAYETPSALFADTSVELAVIATPSHTHGPLAIEALAAGKHVLVEKPLATSIMEADAMIAAATRAGKTLTAYQLRRKAPDFLKIREILDSGVLGPIHLLKMSVYGYSRRSDWQTLRKFGGGQLNNTGTHFIDQALTLAGGRWTNLFADMRHLVSAGDAEDHVKVVFRSCSDTVVDVEITSAAATEEAPPHWVILGRYGALTGSLTHVKWRYYDPSAVPARVARESAAENRAYEAPENLPWVEECVELGPEHMGCLFYNDLYVAIREGKPSPAPATELRNLMALFEACRTQNNL